jgi:hypothetical protein
MSRKLRKSFVRHPGAILFLLFSREGVFQHPQAITLTTPVNEFYKKECQEKSSALTGERDCFSTSSPL